MTAQEYLRELVAINSTRGKEGAVADFIVPILQNLGFTIQNAPLVSTGQRNILARRGDNPTMCVYGHMDTVPVYSGWDTNPFELTLIGEKLYGLGTNDMKGGIAAVLAAIERLPKSTPLKLLFCYDEEYDSDGAWLVATENSEWFQGLETVLSVEPGTASGSQDDGPTITLGRRGRARYVVNILGYSAHGGNSERGVSAISLASRLIQAIEVSPMAQHAQLGEGSQYVASINAKNVGLSVPDFCSLEIERHFVPPETVTSVLRKYQSVCDQLVKDTPLSKEQSANVRISVESKARNNPYMAAFVTPASNSFVRRAVRLMDQHFGMHRITYGRSVADDNILATIIGVPVVVIGPTGGNEHSPNEWVFSEALEQYSKFYEDLLK